MGFYTFKITYYDGSECHDCGITYGRSYAEAVERIEDAYSDCIISIDRIYGFEPSNILILGDNENLIDFIEKNA